MEMTLYKSKLKTVRYTRPLDSTPVKIYFSGNQIWLGERDIANLYGVQTLTARKHLRNAFKKGQLDKDSVTAKLIMDDAVNANFKRVYNQTAIDSVGHRINSAYVLKFHEWLDKRRELKLDE